MKYSFDQHDGVVTKNPLDELDRLEKEATEKNTHVAEDIFRAELAGWYRSSGREMVRDAERYRWLREHAKGAAIYLPLLTESPYFMGLAQGKVLDAAIDSARRTSGDERG